jgi:hypothetical protein
VAEQLRKLFYERCAAHSRAELTLRAWRDMTAGRLSTPLASLTFASRLQPGKHTWRFIDFAVFCVVFGSESSESKLSSLLLGYAVYTSDESMEVAEKVLRVLSIESRTSLSATTPERHSTVLRGSSSNDNSTAQGSGGVPALDQLLHSDEVPAPLAPALQTTLTTALPTLANVSKLLCTHEAVPLLPGLRDLSILACCVFGVRPPSPLLQKDYITELQIRHALRMTTTSASDARSSFSYGGVGSAWCVVRALLLYSLLIILILCLSVCLSVCFCALLIHVM